MDQCGDREIVARIPDLNCIQRAVHELNAILAILGYVCRGDEEDRIRPRLTRVVAMLEGLPTAVAPAAGTSQPASVRGGLASWQRLAVDALVRSNLDKKLSLDDLALATGLSQSHFCRAFRVSFACSPMQYVRSMRVEVAQFLLMTSDEPLSRIALLCGFADQAHFSRTFYAIASESPQRWRRAQLKSVEHANPG